MSILVIGSINTDLVIQVPRIAQKDETVLGDGSYIISQGGKGANQAVAAASAGLPVYMVGKVGNDAFGDDAVQSLQNAGVHCEHISQTQAHATGLATIFLDPEARNSITVAPGANAQITTADIEAVADLIQSADMLMIQLEIPLDACRAAVHIAHSSSVPVLLDPAPAPNLDELKSLDFLHMVDYLTPNEIEAEMLTGMTTDSPAETAAAFLEMGVGNVLMTLGSEGSYIANQHQNFKIETYEVSAVDTTGAGDAYNGFLATALVKGFTLKQAAKIASAAAALSVTQTGARANKLSWDRVLAFM